MEEKSVSSGVSMVSFSPLKVFSSCDVSSTGSEKLNISSVGEDIGFDEVSSKKFILGSLVQVEVTSESKSKEIDGFVLVSDVPKSITASFTSVFGISKLKSIKLVSEEVLSLKIIKSSSCIVAFDIKI